MMHRIYSLLAATLLTGACANAFSTSIYSNTSLLSSGRWVKIATPADGVYQITYDQLRQLGFSNPEQVQVYGYGSTMYTDHTMKSTHPDDIIPNATYHTADGRILFYGQGDATVTTSSASDFETKDVTIARNYYDTRSCYFLSDVRGAVGIPVDAYQEPTVDADNALRSHIHVELLEEDLQTPINGGVGYHGRQYTAGSNIISDCRIKNFSPTPRQSVGSFAYVMALSSSSQTRFPVTASSDVHFVSSTTYPAWSLASNDFNYYNEARGVLIFDAAEDQPLDDTTVSFTISVPQVSLRYCALDRTLLRYPRANVLDAEDPWLLLNFTDGECTRGQSIRFPGADAADLCLWNVDNPASVTVLEGRELDGEVAFTLNSTTRHAVAFKPSATYPAPEILGTVANQNLHGLATPDMVIITTPEYHSVAEQLADLHRQYQGMDVEVIDQELIFNEFSSGVRDVMGYKRLAKMFYDRGNDKFKYLLLFGNTCYDNRSVEVPAVDRLIVYENTDLDQTRNIITNYASDNFLAMLDDNYRHSYIYRQPTQIAVGRIPTLNVAQAGNYVGKAARYFANPPEADVFARALLCAGEGDLNKHLNHSGETANSMLTQRPDMVIVNVPIQAYVDPNASVTNTAFHDIVEQQLLNGVGYFTYSGHGGPTSVGGNEQWSTRYASEVGYDNPPFVMMSSCDQFAFDRMQNGLIETMLFTADGGALGGVGAARSVYINYNQASCEPTAAAYAQSKPGDTYGDIYMRSRQTLLERYDNNQLASGENALINVMNYNLAGDPALPVYAPSLPVTVTDVAGAGTADVTVAPLKPFSIRGRVASPSSVGKFNGPATVTILAAPVTVTTYNTYKESAYEPAEVTMNYDILTKVDTEVVDGIFEAAITAPVPQTIGDNRIILSARDNETGLTAYSEYTGLTIGEYDPTQVDEDILNDNPSIEQLYIGSTTFVPGDETAANIQLKATIKPSASGLRFTTGDIVSRTGLNIDGTQHITNLERFITFNEDGTASLDATVEGLSEGRHTARLTVVNNAGGVDNADIDFVVVTRNLTPTLAVAEEPARTEATITADGATAVNRLLITDIAGATILSVADAAFPYKWNLKDLSGNPVADGRYRASLMVNDGSYYGHSDPVEIIVVR